MEETSLGDEASMYRQALLSGLMTPAEVVSWADRQIMRLNVLPEPLIDASLSGGNLDKLVTALGELGPHKLSESSFRLYAARLLALLEDTPTNLPLITAALNRLAWAKEGPDSIGDEIYGFDDELHLAQELIWGSIKEVEADVREFL